MQSLTHVPALLGLEVQNTELLNVSYRPQLNLLRKQSSPGVFNPEDTNDFRGPELLQLDIKAIAHKKHLPAFDELILLLLRLQRLNGGRLLTAYCFNVIAGAVGRNYGWAEFFRTFREFNHNNPLTELSYMPEIYSIWYKKYTLAFNEHFFQENG